MAVLLWRTGGLMFSPGRLSATYRPGVTLNGFTSHEAFEAKCGLCHQPLKTRQGVLCLECHIHVAEQIRDGDGLHDRIANVLQCYACHSDHQGKDYDLRQTAFASFDHNTTRFSLLRHQVDYDASLIGCAACHQANADFTVSESNCSLCHGKKDPTFVLQHARDFGTTCLDCHDGRDRMADFDHQVTVFRLEGKHSQVACVGCHTFQQPSGARGGGGTPMSQFAGAPLECTGCHAEDNPHAGLTSGECGSCHTPDDWSPARWEDAPFEHGVQAGFSLVHHQHDFDGSVLSCNSCHFDKTQGFNLEVCVSCHSQGGERAAFMLQHQRKYGGECISCHDGVDRMSSFSHDAVFPLDGKHAEIPCLDCHANQIFAGTSKACVQCHAEPAIHAGFFGLECQYCHTSLAWRPALLRLHRFPLDHGGQGEAACQVCHPNSYVETTCYGCHAHQPEGTAEKHQQYGVQTSELLNCAGCHPTGKKER